MPSQQRWKLVTGLAAGFFAAVSPGQAQEKAEGADLAPVVVSATRSWC